MFSVDVFLAGKSFLNKCSLFYIGGRGDMFGNDFHWFSYERGFLRRILSVVFLGGGFLLRSRRSQQTVQAGTEPSLAQFLSSFFNCFDFSFFFKFFFFFLLRSSRSQQTVQAGTEPSLAHFFLLFSFSFLFFFIVVFSFKKSSRSQQIVQAGTRTHSGAVLLHNSN